MQDKSSTKENNHKKYKISQKLIYIFFIDNLKVIKTIIEFSNSFIHLFKFFYCGLKSLIQTFVSTHN